MSKPTKSVRVFEASYRRVKIKAAIRGVNFMEMFDRLSKTNTENQK